VRLKGRHACVLSLVVVFAASCRKEHPGQTRGDPDAVYQALLRAQLEKTLWPKKGIVICTKRASLDWMGYPEPGRGEVFFRNLKGLRRDTYEHFLARQDIQEIAKPAFAEIDGVPVKVVPGVTVEEWFSGPDFEENWKQFWKQHPKTALVEFSAVGFSRDGSQSILQMNVLGWFGSYFLLEKTGEGWRVAQECETWVS